METKLKFKVGDKVRVKSLEWYNGNKDANGLVYLDKQGIVFDETMANLCGKIVQIEEVNRTGYFICGYSGFLQDWMLEDEVITEVITDEPATEVKPKFDPKTLQDFQKVLYRSSNADWWRLGFFDTYNETQDNKFWIIGQDVHSYEQCVPYNEETEHLKGTSEEAPEFYRG